MSDKPTLHLEVVSRSRTVLTTDANMVVVPGEDGQVGILPRHAPMVVSLQPGVVAYTHEGETLTMAVSGGFFEIADDRARILADAAELGDEIDLERAQAAYERARQRLDREVAGDEHFRAEAALHRAMARIEATRARHTRPGYGGRPVSRRMPPAKERDQ